MVDTNSDPRQVDYVIPSNDDASKSINKIMSAVSEAVIEGLAARKAEKEGKSGEAETKAKAQTEAAVATAAVAETAVKEEE
jgi:small subunit ribosomal protein S2